jgi:hypothetical protein
VAKDRVKIPDSLRSQILIANQHACCICGNAGVQIHHINEKPDDNRSANLAVLCLNHHDEATSVTGLSAKLSPSEIRKYKRQWEEACVERVKRAARGRTAFFMVDYKNAERIRQIYAQLSEREFQQAYETLKSEFQEEEKFRQEQGFDISPEPNTAWNEPTRRMLSWVQAGDPHPKPFHKAKGHPQDPMFPTGAIWIHPEIAYYDLWCQIMVRAIIAVRNPFDLDELLKLEKPEVANLAGSLVAFEGQVKGDIAPPRKWEQKPVCYTVLSRESFDTIWRSKLALKTHYVYSVTAAECLSDGYENGVLMIRGIRNLGKKKGKRVVEFDATSLIIGNGILKL